MELPFERDPELGPLLHPGKAARTPVGAVGELHPAILDGEWGVFELDLETLAAAAPERVEYEDVITFPALMQDVAVAVPEDLEAGALVSAVREAGGPELREVRVFDVYRGEQVGEGGSRRAAARLPVARAHALRRGRGDAARADRRRARRALRRGAALLVQSVPGALA